MFVAVPQSGGLGFVCLVPHRGTPCSQLLNMDSEILLVCVVVYVSISAYTYSRKLKEREGLLQIPKLYLRIIERCKV